MLVVVVAALFGTPFADLSTKAAIFFVPLTSRNHHIDADITSINALNAALGAIILAFFPRHFYEASLAIDYAFLTFFDTFLNIHGYCFFGE
jgi:hypothetical protein